jgi:hypothetical protein
MNQSKVLDSKVSRRNVKSLLGHLEAFNFLINKLSPFFQVLLDPFQSFYESN